MLGITWRDRKRATWIREQTKVKDILMTIKKKKWSWAGHIMRRTENRWTKRVTECNQETPREARGGKKSGGETK